jgi:hypothetical protein
MRDDTSDIDPVDVFDLAGSVWAVTDEHPGHRSAFAGQDLEVPGCGLELLDVGASDHQHHIRRRHKRAGRRTSTQPADIDDHVHPAQTSQPSGQRRASGPQR